MEVVITFLEGFISFISPCMLPLLPLYIISHILLEERIKSIKFF